MKPTPVAMVSVLVISLTGCGRFPAENKAPEKCGEAVCVDTPKFICMIASRTMTVLFSVRAQSGKQGAAYTISGAPDAAALNGSYRTEVAPVEHLSQPFQSGGSGPFNNVSISVSESHGDVRVIKVDPDDYC